MVEMGQGAPEGTMGMAADPVSIGGLFLNIGLQNGVLLRTAVDNVTGDLSDTRTRSVTTGYNRSSMIHGQAAFFLLCEKVWWTTVPYLFCTCFVQRITRLLIGY